MRITNVSVYIRNKTIYIKGYVNGTRYRKSTNKENTRANLAWVKKNAYDVLLNLIDTPVQNEQAYTLKEYGYKSFEINSINRKVNTTAEYKATFKKHILPYFGTWYLTDIKPSDLKYWQMKLQKGNRSARTVNDIRSVFRGILQDAYFDELIEKNPFDLVRRPKMEKTIINPFSLEEVKTLIEHSNGWFKNYLIIAFFTGLRSGEMIGLQWKDIDFENNTIFINRSIRKGLITTPKTANSIRDIDMLSIVSEAFKEQYLLTNHSDYVFLNQYGKHYNSSEKIVKYKWRPLLEKCNFEYRILYKTRHTFASIMLQQKEEIAWISKMLGHSDIHTTLTKYARYIPTKNIERAKFLNEFKVA
jgi:integrase